MYSDIREKVNQLIEYYGTNDPTTIAANLGYTVKYTDDFETFTAILHEKLILVNKKLPEPFNHFAIAHELGHIFFDSEPPRDNPVLNSLDVPEDVQNIFATFLLYEDIRENYELDPNYFNLMIRHTIKKATDPIQRREYLPDSDEEFDSSLAELLFTLNLLQIDGSIFS